ncbi:ubiquitin carboxyl-terminal hydrolase 47 [Aplysia californica]|uniref:Ubiquitin carboxyl-terminal hydrolase 47 n=1 Tax=Aplysia californica TaxID=6500 RepID=A0ABM0K3M9_APLCA|nr:ubiquitin carboxyl-terminal hydrolase 47 [Aplysia californica]
MIESRSSVVAASPVDDDKVLCIIRDFVDSHGGQTGKQSLNLQASLSAQQAAQDIARSCGYKENTVSVHYEQQQGGSDDILLEEQDADVSLRNVCCSGAKRHNFTIHELEGVSPEKLGDAADRSGNVFSGKLSFPGNFSVDLPHSSSSSALIKSETGYLGLVNQAMTCYLNSLLQTLYMTPEFRNALYRWSFKGTSDEAVKSIPYQLQRLFLQLQTSKKRAVETTDLTRSFGWDSSEVWQQHDVQELCRVMFDALEQNWKNTVQANLINQLYQGKMKDYVKCLECGYESARVDAYLDIPLVIRPFGSTETHDTVEKAMNAFVQPETLDGSNQYFCEKCNKKCDAHKGLKFVSFPYLLTLQLKRFDFDYATMHRIKLNDRMTFPERLDLNPFVTADEDGLSPLTSGQVDSSDEGIDEGIEVETGCSAASSSSDSSSVSSEAAANNARNSFCSDYKGPYEYELFSIMIHSGSAAGGHYYAYVKAFKDGQWFSFNDQQVSEITLDDIRKTYGGSSGRGFYSSAYTSSTSAYMLMYRRIDRTQNAEFIEPEDFPESLKAELRQQKEKEEAERRQREIDKSTCKIKLYCFHPVDQRKMDVRLEIHKDKTLLEATEIARELLGLQTSVPLDCCRLVKYDEYQDSLEKSFEGEEETAVWELLGGVKANYTFDLLLETKKPEQVFLEYKPGGVTVKVHVVDIHRGVIQPPISVRAYHVQTVQEFKLILQQILGYPAANMRCVLERFHNELRPLSELQKTLKAEGFYKSHKLFVECSGDVKDSSVPYVQSQLCHLLDQYQHTIRITCTLPSRKSLEEYISSLKESPSKAGHSRLDVSSILPLYRHADSSQVDEGISENDSAFYSGGTNSKHSLSGVDPGSNFSISSSTTTETRYGVGASVSASEGVQAAFDTDQESGYFKSTTPRFTSDCEESQSSSGIGEEAGGSGGGGRQHSVVSLPHSSSHEHLTVDMVNLYSKFSSVGLHSSHSDPSIYHSCADNSDSSLQCLGSGPSSGSQEDTSTSAEFNFSCSGPDPEPVLSSPEDGYGFEEDNDEDEGVSIETALSSSTPLPPGGARRPDAVTRGLDLPPSGFSDNYNQFQFPAPSYDDSDDWDRELAKERTACGGTLHSFPSSSSLPQTTGAAEACDPGSEPQAGTEAAAARSETCVSNASAQAAPSTLTQSNTSDAAHPPPLPPPPPPPPPIPPQFLAGSSSLTPRAKSSAQQASVKHCEEEEEVLEVKRYFHAVISDSCETEDRILDVSVDKRITLGAFKRELEPYVGVMSNFFKVYRVYSNNQEFESVRLSDTLSFFEDGKFNIKLGRALQPGEHRVKVYRLCVNEAEPCKYLIETIFAKGMTVLQSKKIILEEVKEQCGLDIPLDRCRLRKKSWTNPGTVYLDSHMYENEIPIYPNWEIFLEVLEGPEELTDSSQLAVYVRHWRPSTHQIDPFQEVVLTHKSVEELKNKISAISNIPAENVEFSKGKGTFPCEVSVLEINNLEWNPHVTSLNMWPLYICDDGHVIYFRDNSEELVELSEEKKKEIQQKENKVSRQTHRISCSPRKERALKIYTDEDDQPSKTSLEVD